MRRARRYTHLGCTVAVLVALAAVAPRGAAGELDVCILRGIGGEPFQEERFREWSRRLTAALTAEGNLDPARIQAYPKPEESDAESGLTRERVAAAFTDLAGRVAPDDTLLLVLIGHGSLQQEPMFMVAGPDIAAEEFKTWMDALPASQQVVINTASSSSAFINVLTAPNRIICTSTRSGTERNAPEFMEHLLRALEQGRGDEDRDGKVTVREWCNTAAAATQQWYEEEGYIATEHALLDDNGDGLGARLPLESGAGEGSAPDGAAAGSVVVKRPAILAGGDPALLAQYREAIAAVQAWKAAKGTVDETAYWARLEELLLAAARINRAIHQGAAPDPAATPE